MVGGAVAQGILGLVPTHLWVRLGPVASASLLIGDTMSWGLWLWSQETQSWCWPVGRWFQGPGIPGISAGQLVGGTRS